MMIITLTGTSSFGLSKEQRSIIGSFVKQYGELALERVDAAEASYERIIESLSALPFLTERKLVVLRDPSTNKQFVENFEQIQREIPATNDVILVEPKLDKRLSYYKFLKKQTDFREINELDQHSLANWLVVTAKDNKGSLSLADARYLIERVGDNQQLVSNEVEKLLLFDPNITRQTIDLLTEETPGSTIFQLLEAAFAGNHRRALQLYSEQRALKIEPPQIIAMLAWQLYVLTIIKTAGDRPVDQIAREARLNPFVVRKSHSIANQLSLAELKKLVKDLLELDKASKSSNLDSDEALQYYLLGLTSK